MKRNLLLTLLGTLLTIASWASARDNYTIIISLDGFRWDYPETFDTPFFNLMARQGVKAVMTPSFPSKTFPNHYTLATGLVPDHHGIIANKFELRGTGKHFSLSNVETRTNPSYFGGDPIWLTAKRQGVTTATVYWVGSDVAIKGEYAHYWRNYLDSLLTHEQRVDEVVQLLSLPEGKRPHFVMAYFEEPDASGHQYGPISRETRMATERIDSLLHTLWIRLQALPIADKINLIVTGDHGMTWVHPERQIFPKDYVKKEWVAAYDNSMPTLIYAKQPQFIDSIYNALKDVDHLRVWRRGEVPAYLNYGTNPNMGDLIALPDVGWVFDNDPWIEGGTHGYDQTASDMWVAFRAMGPDFKVGYKHEHTFRNVCIYPLLCHLLGITPSPNDGSLDEVQDMLR